MAVTNAVANVVAALLVSVLAMQVLLVESIQNGEESQSQGGRKIGFQELRSYLRAFGYLNGGSFTDSSSQYYDDEGLESALKMFQRKYHLNVTGKLDSETVGLINTPRCGVADINVNNLNRSTRIVQAGGWYHAFFKLGVKKWPPNKYHLTYKILTRRAQARVGNYALLQACSTAFQLWARVSHFKFQQVGPDAPADLVISFERRDHGDEAPFEGKGGVLAHANPPMDGRLHLDADENWSFRPPSNNDEFDLIWVVTHEIGHLLGIDHSENVDAVMFAYVTAGKSRRALHPDDIAAIQAMYSKP